MKRVWFAVVFLAIATALCIGEQAYIRYFHSETDKRISAAITAAEQNDTVTLEKETASLQRFWAKSNNLLCTLANHTVPDELGARIRSIRTESGDLLVELESIRAFNNVLYENQRITLANIF